MMQISFLGGGNMAAALIGGMLKQGFDAQQIRVMDIAEDNCCRLRDEFHICATTAMDDAFIAGDFIVLAVKPQQMRQALAPLAGKLVHQTIISIAAGLRIHTLSRWLGGYERIIRTMPNMPALSGVGVTGMYAAENVGDKERDAAQRILEAVGTVLWLGQENDLDAITAISGSGPGFVFAFIEALEAAAVQLGMDAATARSLAVNTVYGSAQLAVNAALPPAVLRQRVTSRGGTTAAGLEVLNQHDLTGLICLTAEAAARRARELGEELDRD